MKGMTKKALSLLLAFLMVVSMFPVSAFAAENSTEDLLMEDLNAQKGSEPAGVESDPVVDDGTVPDPDEGDLYITAGNGGSNIFYVDEKNIDDEENTYISIEAAVEAAKEARVAEPTICLKSDVTATRPINFSDRDMMITITSEDNSRIVYTGAEAIGNKNGFIQVQDNAEVIFSNVTLEGSQGAYDGRVLHVSNGGTATLVGATITNGKVMTPDNNDGGAGIYVAENGSVLLTNGSIVTRNQTIGGGAGIYVAEDGYLEISDATVSGNESGSGLGSGVFAATGSTVKFLAGTVITGNIGEGGVYLERDSQVSAEGNVNISGNTTVGKSAKNLVLAEHLPESLDTGATIDISGTTVDAKICVTAEDEVPYLLISLPVGYELLATRDGDEKGFSLDSDKYDIRYMVYNGVPGLYLFYKTLDATFEDVDTLTDVSGKDINGEDVSYLEEAVPGTKNENGVLSVPDVVAKSGEDFVFSFNCNTEDYRIPTEDVVHVTSGGSNVAFTYEPDFAAGTATVTVAADVIAGLTAPIKFEISAEKYYTMKLTMSGPMYEMTTSITGLTENKLVVAKNPTDANVAEYTLTRDGSPVAGVTVQLFAEGSSAEAVPSEVSGEDGVVRFEGLDTSKAYFPVLVYSKDYRVIARDVVSLDLSTLDGQELDSNYKNTTGDVTYDKSTGKATISNVKADGEITFQITQMQDSITFHSNEGDATTKATLSLGDVTGENSLSKVLEASSQIYGTLAAAELTGYTFDGWYTQPEGGELVTSATAYNTLTSAKDLYAHWSARTDTAYKIQHWVEFKENGVNCNNEKDQYKTVNGVKYYLYAEVDYADGTSDAVKDITGLGLESMSCEEHTWWSLDGMDEKADENCKVLADGSSVFSILYDRKAFTITFKTPLEGGTASSTTPIDPMTVDFGDMIGEMPAPTLPSYSFGGWHLDGQQVNGTDPYRWTDNVELTAKFNAQKDTNYAIKIVTQDIAKYPDNGVYYTPGTYTKYDTVYKANDGSLLAGETDTRITFNVDDIKALSIPGFTYVGYSADFDRNANGMIPSTTTASVYVKPTEVSSANGDKYNTAFDKEGGIVYLYYNRMTADCITEDGQGNEKNNGELIYGGDFTGHLPKDPAKDGYDFSGWVDPSGKPIVPGTPADEYVKDGEDIKIIPTWTAREYSLTYVPGPNASFIPTSGTVDSAIPSGSVAGGYIDPSIVTYDQPMGKMPTASKVGYTFDGWYLEDGTKITSETIVDINSVVISNADADPAYKYENTRVLYAHFVPHTYTLKFNPMQSKTGVKGTVSPETMTVTYDQVVGTMPTPVLEGYDFGGWVLDLTDFTSTVTASDVWKRAYTNGAVINLYALWTPNTYRYNFNLNDRNGSTRGSLVGTDIDYVDIKFDSVYDGAFAVEATRAGYKFMGWSLSSTGPVLTKNDLNTISKGATLYAIWEAKEYDVRLVMNGGKIADLTDNTNLSTFDPTASYDKETDTWTIKVKFDSVYGELPVVTKTDCTYHGYLADAPGWPADAGYGVTVDGEILTSLPQYIDFIDADGITLRAVLEPWFTFNPATGMFEDGSVDPVKKLQSDITELPAAKRDHYTYDGWQTADGKPVTVDDLKGMKEPISIVPVFLPNVMFDAKGGTFADGSTDVKEIAHTQVKEFPSVSKKGWTFIEWQDKDGNPVSLDALKDIDEPLELVAFYKANIKFDPQGNAFVDNGSTDPREIPSTEIPDKLPEVVKPGYTFDGWTTVDGTPVTPEDLRKAETPIDVIPAFTPNAIFDPQGGKFVDDKTTAPREIPTTKIPDKLPEVQKDGYTFLGWKDEDGKIVTAEDLKGLTEPKTVTPIYCANIIFDANGGKVQGSSTYEVRHDTLKELPTATRESTSSTAYSFNGWFTAVSGGTKVTLEMLQKTETTMTVYAQYSTRSIGGGGGWTPTPSRPTVIPDPVVPVVKDPIGELFTNDHIAYVVGREDGKVHPEANITRAEVAMMFYRLLKDDVRSKNMTDVCRFEDVPANAWYRNAVCCLINMGILQGRTATMFVPNEPITRAELAALAARFSGPVTNAKMPFTDVDRSFWAFNEIAIAHTNGWVFGDNNLFRPLDNITRAETMALVNRFLGRSNLALDSLIRDGMVKWPDNADTSKWYYLDIQEATNSHEKEMVGGYERWTELKPVKVAN